MQFQTKDSILSITVLDRTLLAVGQAAGHIDFIKIGVEKIEPQCSAQLEKSGYINKVCMTSSVDGLEVAFGCEKGLFFGRLNKDNTFSISKEKYLEDSLVSQVY